VTACSAENPLTKQKQKTSTPWNSLKNHDQDPLAA